MWNSATADIIHPGENWKLCITHFPVHTLINWENKFEGINLKISFSSIRVWKHQSLNDLKMKRSLSAPARTVLCYYHIWVQSGKMYYASFCASLLLASSCNNAGCNGRCKDGKLAYLPWKLLFLGQIFVLRTSNFPTSNSSGENHFIANICILLNDLIAWALKLNDVTLELVSL